MINMDNDKLRELLERATGLKIGDGNTLYIQDSGIKKVGVCYIDKTGDLCECLIENTDTEDYLGGNYRQLSLSKNFKLLNAMNGNNMSCLMYIQHPGHKHAGQLYIDNKNNKMYICIADTTATVNNTDSFKPFNMIDIYDKNELNSALMVNSFFYNLGSYPENVKNVNTVKIPLLEDHAEQKLRSRSFWGGDIYISSSYNYGNISGTLKLACSFSGRSDGSGVFNKKVSKVYSTTATQNNYGVYFEQDIANKKVYLCITVMGGLNYINIRVDQNTDIYNTGTGLNIDRGTHIVVYKEDIKSIPQENVF